ncbi:MAG: quinolinate synthase, partial [Verrucomicrobia bacterium]|nr:quinolinate synthase [Verrucomicrobiota bacterium]
CRFMKMNTITKLLECLRSSSPEISMDTPIIEKSRLPIEKMLEWSN